jgi:hypothetical protein
MIDGATFEAICARALDADASVEPTMVVDWLRGWIDQALIADLSAEALT